MLHLLLKLIITICVPLGSVVHWNAEISEAISAEERAHVLQEIFAQPDNPLADISYSAKVAKAIDYMENFTDEASTKFLIPAYLEMNQTAKATAALVALNTETIESREFKEIYTLLTQAKATNRTFTQFTKAEWSQLRTLAKHEISEAGALAQNLLYQYKGEYYPIVPKSVVFNKQENIANGLKSNEEASINFALYPNPTNDKLTLVYTTGENLEVLITDLLGKVVYAEKLATSSSSHEINVHFLASGAYLCTLKKQGNSVANQKIIKN